MLCRARQFVHWPAIDAKVEQKWHECPVCEVHAPSQPAERLIPMPPSQYPFQQAETNLFQLDSNMYLVYADRLKGWLEVEHISGEASSSRLITAFCRWFRRLGIPETSPVMSHKASSI